VKNGDEQTIETICMNVDELLYFLRTAQNVIQFHLIYSYEKENFFFNLKQTIIQCRSTQIKDHFSLQPIATHEQIQQLINEFEPNVHLQEKGLLSLNGLYYSENNSIISYYSFSRL